MFAEEWAMKRDSSELANHLCGMKHGMFPISGTIKVMMKSRLQVLGSSGDSMQKDGQHCCRVTKQLDASKCVDGLPTSVSFGRSMRQEFCSRTVSDTFISF